MRLITWNINSVRLRMPLLKTLTEELSPDIVCLQETKVQDADFPLSAIQTLGYNHVEFSGEKSYNGVAILSKIPLQRLDTLAFAELTHKRHLSVRLPNGQELHNVYIPAGGDEPDPAINQKYREKLKFVEDMNSWFSANRKASAPLILVGDFNIAPHEHDVWSHTQLLNVVSHTPAETERLLAFKQSLSWIDVARKYVPMEEKLYSWWSYRNRDWKISNRGRRLDHIWVTPALEKSLTRFYIHPPARDWPSPSDHVPVMVEMEG